MTGGCKPYPRGDLYVSYNDSGKWTVARHLEHNINTVAEEEFPFLTPDGRYLFSRANAACLPCRSRSDSITGNWSAIFIRC